MPISRRGSRVSPTMAARHLDLDAILAMARPLDRARMRRIHATLEAARPAHRARLGRGVLLRLCARARRLAARPARRSCRSRRSRTKRRRTIAMSAGCPAAIRSCTPGSSRRRAASATGLRNSRRPARCTASAAATWCSAKGWRTLKACAMRWRVCSATRRALPSASCISAIARRGCLRTVRSARPATSCAATSSITPRSSPKGDDEPFVDVTDAQGRPVTETGSRRGRVSGTFFHAIARET